MALPRIPQRVSLWLFSQMPWWFKRGSEGMLAFSRRAGRCCGCHASRCCGHRVASAFEIFGIMWRFMV